MTTPFPCVRDWTMAVQLPSVRFRGTPLAQLTAERRPGGLVQVERGTFCYTFKIRLQGRVQALRCPHMPAPHREDRLEALMRFFQTHPCPHFVPFQVYRHATTLPGFPQPFSVTGMDWVEGQALDDWFDANHGDSRALQAMADRWLALMRDLQLLGIAHGDLQHGNILVRNGTPVLVDYDACWAPTTARWPSDEVGHPNYAHPGRTPDLYGPQMDAFSGLSIHLSLLAAARMPDLAREAAQSGQMDQLLLSRHDYLQPDASIRFQRMIAAADPEVSQRAAQLRAMCLADAASIRYDWNRCALAGSTALPATSGAGTRAKRPLQGTGAPMIPASTPAWLVRPEPQHLRQRPHLLRSPEFSPHTPRRPRDFDGCRCPPGCAGRQPPSQAEQP
jgi:predicted Ser/Thr protein kinase